MKITAIRPYQNIQIHSRFVFLYFFAEKQPSFRDGNCPINVYHGKGKKTTIHLKETPANIQCQYRNSLICFYASVNAINIDLILFNWKINRSLIQPALWEKNYEEQLKGTERILVVVLY